MRQWSNKSTVNNAQYHKVNRTFSLRKDINDKFKRICFEEGRTQSKMLDILCQRYTEART